METFIHSGMGGIAFPRINPNPILKLPQRNKRLQQVVAKSGMLAQGLRDKGQIKVFQLTAQGPPNITHVCHLTRQDMSHSRIHLGGSEAEAAKGIWRTSGTTGQEGTMHEAMGEYSSQPLHASLELGVVAVRSTVHQGRKQCS